MARGLAALLLAALALTARGAPGPAFDCPAVIPDPSRAGEATLVIIIDDIGHRREAGLATARLPGRLTLAVLPFTPHGAALARLGHLAGKEIMLHAPMSNQGDSRPLGKAGLSTELQEQEFRAALAMQLGQVPYVRGVNNHMGSELTRHSLQMGWLMDELGARDLYFIDSRTTAETVAANTAREHQIPHLSRKVFLDNEPSAAAIAVQFEQAVKEAKTRGLAVAIGHPYPETIAFLQQALPTLPQQGIHLAWASEMVSAGGRAECPEPGAALQAGR